MKNKESLNRPRLLDGDRIFLTPVTMEDLENNYLWDNNPEIAYLDGGVVWPKSKDKIKKEIEGLSDNKKMIVFSIILKENGEHFGNIAMFKIDMFHRFAHWGLVLAKPYWRQKYGTEAARLIIKYAFEDLGFHKLRSGAHEKNIASIKFQENLGLIREGTFRKERYIRGEYYDDIQFGLLRDEYSTLPQVNQ